MGQTDLGRGREDEAKIKTEREEEGTGVPRGPTVLRKEEEGVLVLPQ